MPFSAKKWRKEGLTHTFFCNDEVIDFCQDFYLLEITDFGEDALGGKRLEEKVMESNSTL